MHRYGNPQWQWPVTAGYALFQAANNTAVMTEIRPDQRGVVSGVLNLSRNLGLITGASVMGAVFAHASATIDATAAHPEVVAAGMRITFSVAAMLIGRRARHGRRSPCAPIERSRSEEGGSAY